ncbi:AAA family ATPase [Glaciihabitans arcticus]|uniref:AAA family ATPase n=1 Tax=Glaciihabitans arcticus TaxID=2668039 RepID=A0A4Q9GNW9_9MICO|nr:RNA polymerase recycling motor ATPase HelR [Glaciihabitans arcticus]TBN56502.1 AAA family ATPase [Glaciihabitans arcticus]
MTAPFDLPDRLSAKNDPALIARDVAFFATLASSLDRSITELEARLDATRLQPGGSGQETLERDLEIHRLTARLRTLRRFGLDLCLGCVVSSTGEAVYIGRLGMRDPDGNQLLVDWRSPAAEPFFGATHANPMSLTSRRRFRWMRGRITDYWDEVFEGTLQNRAALDDQSAFIASLGSDRSERMRDVLGTIQADQDAIIRAGSRGALVVDGGPGTGKTVVALHRAAYLLYSDPRLGRSRGGALFVGPHQPYLNYVADVLPGLGEEGVETCTLRDLLPEGASAIEERDARVAGLKASSRLIEAIEPAVALYEEPPTVGMSIETPWGDVWLSAAEWAEAFDAREEGTPHNEAREQVLEELVTILSDNFDEPPAQLRRYLLAQEELIGALNKAWPLIEAPYVLGTLWSVPAYLRRCAPWLDEDDVAALQRPEGSPWTVADMPLLDAARQRIGDSHSSARRLRQERARVAERSRRAAVIDDLIAADDGDLKLMSMLRGEDAQNSLDDASVVSSPPPDALAGPFAHIVVDEAQELTDAEWQMLLSRCPSRSFTIVGDRAQARHGFTSTWEAGLALVGFDAISVKSLTINYRTPSEIMDAAAPVIRAAIPDANVPTSIRSSGIPVSHFPLSARDDVLAAWLSAHAEGSAVVIGDPAFTATSRVRSLSPTLAKGLEFDLVVLVSPSRWGGGIEGAVDRYVAMTRATQRLVVLEG